MKILFVNETMGFVGGLEQYIFSLSKVLSGNGHQCSLLYAKSSGKNCDQFARYFFQCYQIDFSHSPQFDGVALRKILIQERPDVAFLHKISNARMIHEIHRSVPTVRMIHDVAPFCPSNRKFYYFSGKLCYRKMGLKCYLFPGCYRLTHARLPFIGHGSLYRTKQELKGTLILDHIIVASNYMRDQLLMHGCPLEKLTVLRLFFDAKIVTISSKEEYQNVILFLGNVNKSKGLDWLIKSLEFVRSPYQTIVIGDGKELQYNKSLAAKLGFSERIEFLGWIDYDRIKNYFRNALMLVVPSRWPEPFGLVGLEAMAHGVPVIASNVGGIPDWLEDGKNGFLVERGNIRQLAEKIELLLTDRNLNQKLGEYGRTCVITKYNPDDYVKKLMRIFEQAIQKRRNEQI